MADRIVRADGSITIPRELREQANLAAGDRVRISHVAGGLFIRPADHDDGDQAWYWTEDWQQGEREADEDAHSANSTVYESGELFEAHLRRVHEQLIALGR
jgi:AbrB family looped-hinge helix DNA binding protein